jgi:hypothetical protein
VLVLVLPLLVPSKPGGAPLLPVPVLLPELVPLLPGVPLLPVPVLVQVSLAPSPPGPLPPCRNLTFAIGRLQRSCCRDVRDQHQGSVCRQSEQLQNRFGQSFCNENSQRMFHLIG